MMLANIVIALSILALIIVVTVIGGDVVRAARAGWEAKVDRYRAAKMSDRELQAHVAAGRICGEPVREYLLEAVARDLYPRERVSDETYWEAKLSRGMTIEV
jgi:hypothetical protein